MTRLIYVLTWLFLLAGVAFGQAVERNPSGKPFWAKQSSVWTTGQCLVTDGANQASFQTCPGGTSADIEAVGDCTSGACFTDGTSNGSKLVYEGATVNGNQTTLTFTGDPGGDYTVTIPNITGTLVTTGDSGTVTGAMIANGASGVDLTADVTGTLPVANGGTNLTAATDDNVPIGNGTTWQAKALPACTDTGGNHLNYDAATNALSCGTSNSGTTGAPTAAQYLTLATDGTLSAERVLTPGVGIAGVDSGADSPYTISFASTELGNLTWGDNTTASIAWTVATNGSNDPTLTFTDNLVTVGSKQATTLTTTDTSNMTLNANTLTVNATSGTALYTGLTGTVNGGSGTGAGVNLRGLIGFTTAAGAADTVTALYGYGRKTGSADVTTIYGGRFTCANEGTGTVTNCYGLYVDDVTGSISNAYALYTAGTESSSLGGPLIFRGSSSGATTIAAGTTPATATYTLPTAAAAANGAALTSTTGGALSWVSPLPLANGGTGNTSWTIDRCVRVNHAGTALEVAGADCGTASGISALRDDGGDDTTGTTVTILGDEGITTNAVGSQMVLNWAPAELGDVTWFTGSQASQTFTFAVTGTDPVLTFSDSSINVSTGTLKQGGTAVSLTGHTHAGTDITSGAVAIANGGTGETSKTPAFDALAPTISKGDIIVHNGTDNVRLTVGTNGQILVADSTAAGGVKWAASSSGVTGAGTEDRLAVWDAGNTLTDTSITVDSAGSVTGEALVTNTTADQFSASWTVYANPASSASATYVGSYNEGNYASDQTLTGTLAGVYAVAAKAGTGTVANAYGLRASVSNGAANAITNGYAIYLPGNTAGGGGITNNYGLYQAGTESNRLGGALSVNNLITGATTVTATSGSTYGLDYLATLSNSSSSTALVRAARGRAVYSGSAAVTGNGRVIGVVGTADNSSTSAVNLATAIAGAFSATTNDVSTTSTLEGLVGTATKAGAGAVTTAFGVVGQVGNASASGAITTGAAFYAEPPTLTGTITDYAAILIPDQGGGYGIHQTGDEVNLLSGALEVYNDVGLTGGNLGVTGGIITENITSTDTTNPAAVGIETVVTANPASASSQNLTGGAFSVTSGVLAASNLTGTLTGVDVSSTHYGTGTSTATAVVGVNAYAGKASAGPVTTLYGVKTKVGNASGSGTVGTAYGVYIDNSDTTGTITNDFALYTAGAEKSYFGGPLGVGTTTVPKGSVGLAKVAIHGTDASLTAGPHLQFTTSADDRPLIQIVPYQHDNEFLAWDAYLNSAGSAWVSADSNANFLFDKGGTVDSTFTFSGNFGTTAGNDIGLTTAWTPIWRATSTELVINDSGASRDFRVEGDTDANALVVDGSADAVGIGTAAPGAKLDVLAGTLGSKVACLNTTVANDDPQLCITQQKITTTDENTALAAVYVSTSSVQVQCWVTGHRTGGTGGSADDSAAYARRALFKNGAQIGTTQAVGTDIESQDWDAGLVVSSGTIYVTVKGAANNNISWAATCFNMPMGT